MTKDKRKTRVRLWQAGDLPGIGNRINFGEVKRLVKALVGLECWGYTHKPVNIAKNAEVIRYCNDNNVTINLSANSPAHADQLVDLNIGPVTTTLPSNATKHSTTPAGRRVIICPAVQSDNITCMTCGGSRGALCARVDRKYIIGFPAHGGGSKKVSEVAKDYVGS